MVRWTGKLKNSKKKNFFSPGTRSFPSCFGKSKFSRFFGRKAGTSVLDVGPPYGVSTRTPPSLDCLFSHDYQLSNVIDLKVLYYFIEH